jgi:hypothetical protein
MGMSQLNASRATTAEHEGNAAGGDEDRATGFRHRSEGGNDESVLPVVRIRHGEQRVGDVIAMLGRVGVEKAASGLGFHITENALEERRTGDGGRSAEAVVVIDKITHVGEVGLHSLTVGFRKEILDGEERIVEGLVVGVVRRIAILLNEATRGPGQGVCSTPAVPPPPRRSRCRYSPRRGRWRRNSAWLSRCGDAVQIRAITDAGRHAR